MVRSTEDDGFLLSSRPLPLIDGPNSPRNSLLLLVHTRIESTVVIRISLSSAYMLRGGARVLAIGICQILGLPFSHSCGILRMKTLARCSGSRTMYLMNQPKALGSETAKDSPTEIKEVHQTCHRFGAFHLLNGCATSGRGKYFKIRIVGWLGEGIATIPPHLAMKVLQL